MNNSTPRYWVIVPAAGSGSRMGLRYPKQYLSLQGKPVIQQTLERLCLPTIAGLVVCLAPTDCYWQTLSLQLPVPLWQVSGGEERYHTVLNGLRELTSRAQPTDWVLVHDAARPCVRPADIEKLMTQLAEHPVGGLLAVPTRDTLKRVAPTGQIVETVDRKNLWHALTPQMFRLNLLLTALERVITYGETVTDEAQAIERLGYAPVLIEGHADNIKITHPHDLLLAELFLQQQASNAH